MAFNVPKIVKDSETALVAIEEAYANDSLQRVQRSDQRQRPRPAEGSAGSCVRAASGGTASGGAGVTEKPIIFSGPMVRVILGGRKSQTRRICKPQPLYVTGHDNEERWYSMPGSGSSLNCYDAPYQVGDSLWVRERHCWPTHSEAELPRHVVYAADWNGDDLAASKAMRRKYPELARAYPESRWRPSIHMLRRDARLYLRVTAVRCEQLQSISCADAIAEGCAAVSLHDLDNDSPDPRDEYRDLWDSLNAKRAPWAANPWVWAITFERTS